MWIYITHVIGPKILKMSRQNPRSCQDIQDPRSYQEIQDRFQEYICRTCSSSASNASSN